MIVLSKMENPPLILPFTAPFISFMADPPWMKYKGLDFPSLIDLLDLGKIPPDAVNILREYAPVGKIPLGASTTPKPKPSLYMKPPVLPKPEPTPPSYQEEDPSASMYSEDHQCQNRKRVSKNVHPLETESRHMLLLFPVLLLLPKIGMNISPWNGPLHNMPLNLLHPPSPNRRRGHPTTPIHGSSKGVCTVMPCYGVNHMISEQPKSWAHWRKEKGDSRERFPGLLSDVVARYLLNANCCGGSMFIL